jgi:hypothetical protein
MALGAAPTSLGWSIVSTDGDHLALKNIRQNLGLNRLIGRVAVEQWDWYTPELPKWATTVDLVVASDVVYGNLCPSTAYFFLARRLAEILSPTSPCGVARRAGALPPPTGAGGGMAARPPDNEAGNGSLGDGVPERRPPQALLLLQVRDGGYSGSTVEAFALELERRGLCVTMESIPADALSAAPEENRAALRLLRVAAPPPPHGGAPFTPAIDYGPRPHVEEPAAATPVAGDPLAELQWGEIGES